MDALPPGTRLVNEEHDSEDQVFTCVFCDCIDDLLTAQRRTDL